MTEWAFRVVTLGYLKAEAFIAYFQSYSNTYAPVEKLKEIYDSVFFDEKIVSY